MGTPTIPRPADRLVLSDGTVLPVGAVADGGYLLRSGSGIASGSPPGDVTSVFGRSGAVTGQSSDYSSIYQPLDAELTALAGLTSAADKAPYFTGSGSASVTDFTALARTLAGKSTLESLKSYLGLPRWYDVVASDWLSDAAAGSGGVWNYLTDGAVAPSGWTYSLGSGATPTIMRINADGSLQIDETPAGADLSAEVYKDFTVVDAGLWPFIAMDWTANGDLYAATDFGIRSMGFRNSAGTTDVRALQRKGSGATNAYMLYSLSGGSSSSTSATSSTSVWAASGYRSAFRADLGSFDLLGGSPLAPVHHWSLADSAGAGIAGTDRKWVGAQLGATVRCRVAWSSSSSRPRIRDTITALRVFLGN